MKRYVVLVVAVVAMLAFVSMAQAQILSPSANAVNQASTTSSATGGVAQASASSGTASAGNVSNTVGNTNSSDNQQAQFQVGGSPVASITSIGSPIPRSFPVPAEFNYPGQPQYFAQPTEDPNFAKAGVLLLYKKVWTRAELEQMTGGSVKVNAKMLVPPKNKEEMSPDDTIEITIKKPEYPIDMVGYIEAKTKDADSNSMEVLAAGALAALDAGAKVLFLTAEGYSRIIKSSGWGIGLSYSHANIIDGNGGQSQGWIGSGGFGYSSGEAGYKSKPWLQMFALKPVQQ